MPYFVFLMLLIFLSCSDLPKTARLQEGTIEYSINYPEQSLKRKSFLPDKMVFKFSDKACKNSFFGLFGLYHIDYVASSKKNSSYLLFSLNQSDYLYWMKETDPHDFSGLDHFELTEADEVLTIDGFTCKKIHLRFTKSDEIFEAFYTTQIDCKQKSISNLFGLIKGTMLQFTIIQSKPKRLKMTFKANTIKAEKIPAEEYQAPTDVNILEKSQMESLLDTNFI